MSWKEKLSEAHLALAIKEIEWKAYKTEVVELRFKLQEQQALNEKLLAKIREVQRTCLTYSCMLRDSEKRIRKVQSKLNCQKLYSLDTIHLLLQENKETSKDGIETACDWAEALNRTTWPFPDCLSVFNDGGELYGELCSTQFLTEFKTDAKICDLGAGRGAFVFRAFISKRVNIVAYEREPYLYNIAKLAAQLLFTPFGCTIKEDSVFLKFTLIAPWGNTLTFSVADGLCAPQIHTFDLVIANIYLPEKTHLKFLNLVSDMKPNATLLSYHPTYYFKMDDKSDGLEKWFILQPFHTLLCTWARKNGYGFTLLKRKEPLPRRPDCISEADEVWLREQIRDYLNNHSKAKAGMDEPD